MKRIIIAFLLAAVLFSCGCTNNKKEDDGRIKVVATLFPQYDFARQIAGDRAQVELLLPPGVDSHSFDPSLGDITKISGADVFIYTGEQMEPWTAAVTDTIDAEKLLDVSESVELVCASGEHHQHAHGSDTDPHIWTSPENAVLISVSIASALSDADPENADYYMENLTEYIGSLKYLSENIRETVENSARKKLYFGGKFSFLYFVREYGLEYESLYDSCSESAEPSAKKLGEMTDEIKENGIPVILYPELSEPRAAKSIAESTGAVPMMLHSCHNLSADDFEAGKTYLEIMYENLEVIREALS